MGQAGQWDASRGGSHRDVPGTPSGTMGQAGQWDASRGGSPRDVPGTPSGTMGQAGQWDYIFFKGESLGYPRSSHWGCGKTSRGSLWDNSRTPGGTDRTVESLGYTLQNLWDLGQS